MTRVSAFSGHAGHLRLEIALLALFLSSAVTAGCSNTPDQSLPTDSGADTASEAGTGQDASLGDAAGHDASLSDAGYDATADARADASDDAAPDASYDAAPFVCPGYDAAITTDTDAGSADDGEGGLPPLPSGTSATTVTTARNFALHHIHLGDETDPIYGTAGWKAYGYNLDGLVTTQTSTNVCTPNPTASDAKDQVDGPGGLDNSFGENIVGPLLSLLIANPSQTVDTNVAAGKFTFMMDVTGLSDTPDQTASGLRGSLFAGLNFGTGSPTFTTADNWPISSADVMGIGPGGVLAQPICPANHLLGAYVVNGTFVSGAPQDVTLTLSFGAYQLVLPLEHAVITFRSPGDAGATQAAGGIIAGVINTQQLIASVGRLLAVNNLCDEASAIAPAIEQASDILDDGTNVAGTPCTAISVGIGFDADEIAQPTIAATPPSPGPGCDAGADGG